MLTKVAPFSDDAILEAAQVIMAGQPVAVPTETVYGLAADATSATAIASIYAAKGRPAFNPLIVHVTGLDQARTLGIFNETALKLAAAHWPGALTIVVPLRSAANIPAIATAGLSTIALRVPDHRVMQAMLHATGLPLAAPSANASGTISPTRADHVLRTLNGRIPMVIDDGPTPGGIESTIVKIKNDTVHLLRPGPIVIKGAIVSGRHDAVEAPGQLAAHYAPSKPLRLGATCRGGNETWIGFGPIAGDISLSTTADLEEAASRLFDLLHWADSGPSDGIAVAPVPEKGLGIAINDRLRRAAAGARQ